ncbi:MAG: YceI family protein, partial [Nitrospinae bacterium]|nr:YceI family protein [Nitrospinota bacterium]
MTMRHLPILLALAALLAAPVARGETFTVDPSRLSVRWIAYKTPAKAPVGGTFKTLSPTGQNQGGSLSALLTGAKVTIDGLSVDTGNPGRDENLVKGFFGLFAGQGAIEASIESLFGDNKEGTLTLAVTMNGVTRKVPLSYTLADGVFKAEGYVDLFDFSLNR